MPDLAALRHLVCGEVVQPLAHEPVHVVVIGGRLAEDLRVARPAQAFIPLRAVRRHVEEIAALPPKHVGEELIQLGIRAGDMARPADGGVHGNRRKLLRAYVLHALRPFRQANHPKAVEREARMIDVHPFLAGVADFRLRRAVVFVVEVAVPVKHLGVLDEHLVPLLRRDGERHIAGHLLTEVHHDVPLRGGEDPLRLHALLLANLLAFLLDQRVVRIVERLHRNGRRRNKRGVKRFAVVDLALADGALAAHPGFVRADDRLRAVLVFHVQPRQQRARMALSRAPKLIAESDRGGKPSPPNQHGELVAFFKLRRHVIVLHLQAVRIGRPARRKHELPNAASVQPRLVHAQRRDRERRPVNPLLRCDRFEEYRHRICILKRCSNPLTLNDHNRSPSLGHAHFAPSSSRAFQRSPFRLR